MTYTMTNADYRRILNEMKKENFYDLRNTTHCLEVAFESGVSADITILFGCEMWSTDRDYNTPPDFGIENETYTLVEMYGFDSENEEVRLKFDKDELYNILSEDYEGVCINL